MGIITPGLYIFTSLADQPISSLSQELHRFEAELSTPQQPIELKCYTLEPHTQGQNFDYRYFLELV